MKIKSRSSENKAYEARTISILKFALYALIPLTLAFIMGFSFSGAKKSNDNNMAASGQSKKITIDSLSTTQKELEDQIEDFYALIGIADSTLNEFKSTNFPTLFSRLQQISDDVEFKAWENDLDLTEKQFNLAIESIEEGDTSFENNTYLRLLFSEYIGLINKYAALNTQYFVSEKLRRKQGQGLNLSKDLEKEIEALKDKNREKDREIDQLNNDIRATAAASNNSQKDVKKVNTAITDVEKEISLLKAENKGIQKSIQQELATLDDIISNQFRIRDAHTKDDIKIMTSKLNLRLSVIKTQSNSLTIR